MKFIETHVTLKLTHILKYQAILYNHEMDDIISEMISYIESKNAKDHWSKIETKIQRDQFFKETFSKITITDEIIKCFISYDKIASHLTGIDLIIDEIPRNLLMKNVSAKA